MGNWGVMGVRVRVRVRAGRASVGVGMGWGEEARSSCMLLDLGTGCIFRLTGLGATESMEEEEEEARLGRVSRWGEGGVVACRITRRVGAIWERGEDLLLPRRDTLKGTIKLNSTLALEEGAEVGEGLPSRAFLRWETTRKKEGTTGREVCPFHLLPLPPHPLTRLFKTQSVHLQHSPPSGS